MPDANPLPSLTTASGSAPRIVYAGGSQAQAIVATVLTAEFGCCLVHLRTGEATLAYLRDHDMPDLIVIDGAPADMPGAVLARLIHAARGEDAPPVLALADANGQAAGDRPPFSSVLTQPFSPRDFHKAICKSLKSAAAGATGRADAALAHA